MTESLPEFGTFFLPGPTEVRREVLEAMLRPMIPHRSAAFEELFARVQAGLKQIFRTSRPVFIVPSSGTGMMEAAIRCAPEGRILSLVNGAFSERFAHIAEMCGRAVDRYEVGWGQWHHPEELDNYLTKAQYSAITVAQSETSTGALNDVRSLSDVAHSHGIPCLIDSVSGLGGAELRFDEWKLDYVLTGSQKALALPPGLAFSVASQAFIDTARNVAGRGVYFDLVEMEHFAERGQVPSTPALSLMYALDVQVKAINAEGIENRWGRHSEMAAMTNKWVTACRNDDGLDICNIVDAAHRSPTVSTIKLPDGVSSTSLLPKVASRGITVATGYGKLKDQTFRIGHMGDHTTATLERCLDACRSALLEH
ncbi:MAG TPA: alanine--glyoxylate aminotransferase family protein [Gemmatimonadaceae bacterium]|nr:alanine--glyoxylate aminotransferase family protein [Gemmatimonadaceae bacterium]